MINIAYVIDQMWNANGGTEKQLLLLLDHLDKTKFKLHLICLRNTAWLDSADLPCPVLVLGLTSFKPASFYRAFRRFQKYCRENKIQIVQTFFRDGNLFGTIAAFLANIRLIISSRRNFGGYWQNRFWVLALRTMRKVTSHYICNSTIVADHTSLIEKVDRDRISVIYNGLKLDSFQKINAELRANQREKMGLEPHNILIGVIANLRPVKNLALFVKAARELYRECPNTRFIIVGEGPEQENLENLIDEYELNTVFRLEGLQRDVLPYLAALDIGVLCSRSESFSNSITEYMASGIPSVVSEAGGNTEVLGGVGGLSFESDNLSDFHEKLRILAKDESLRQELGRQAQAYANDTFDYTVMIRRHADIYSELAAGKA